MAIGTPTDLAPGLDNSGAWSGAASSTTVAAAIGDLVVAVGCSNSDGTSVTSCSDSAGNTYAFANKTFPGTTNTVFVCYSLLTHALPTGSSITPVLSSSDAWFLSNLVKVTGITSQTPDVNLSGSGTAAGFTQASGALAQSEEILIGAVNIGGNFTSYTSTGFTVFNNGSGGVTSFDYKIVASTSSVNWTPAWTGSTAYDYVLLSFKGASSGPVYVGPPRRRVVFWR